MWGVVRCVVWWGVSLSPTAWAPCFGIAHSLSLICQLTSEDVKLNIIVGTGLFRTREVLCVRRQCLQANVENGSKLWHPIVARFNYDPP